MHECIVRTFLAPKAAKGVTIFVPLSLDSFISLSEALNPTLDLDNPFKIIKIVKRLGLGLGTWDLGPGTWDLGPGTWDLGPRT